jgi:hypothetical protein
MARRQTDADVTVESMTMRGKPLLTISQRRRRVDDAVDAYVEWREECVRVWEAYHRWMNAGRTDAALAFLAYVAALDREERAAEVYAGHIARLDHLVGTSPAPAPECDTPAPRASRP